jgi:hypothetical protein
MRSFFLSREHIPVFITLGIVIILGCGYYFIYLPKSESAIKRWKFRTLQNVERNIHTKIEIGHKQLKTYLSSNELKTKVTNSKSLAPLNAFLTKQRSVNFPITQIAETTGGRFMDSLSGSGLKKRLTLVDVDTIGSATYSLALVYDFEKFIKPILPDHVFDAYLVIANDEVLYETFFSGLDPSKDTTLNSKGNLYASQIIERQFAGIDYKLFVQPVKLDNGIQLVVIGLLSNDNFFHIKTRLPPRLVLFLITVFICILVTFPILKLYQLGEEDRLTLTDAISVTIVSMLLMAMLFLSFVKYGKAFSNPNRHARTTLANKIKEQFLAEITRNYNALTDLNHLIETNSICNQDYYSITDIKQKKNQNDCFDEINRIVAGIDLDRVFWIDSLGREFRTWKASKLETVFPGQFNERAYFKNILEEKDTYVLNGKGPLYVEQVISWISGNFLTDISIPSNFDSAKVVAVSFRTESLKSSRIPPGYTFAMIDPAGRVLYHSDATKNLNENLFDEFSDMNDLKARMKTGDSSSFNTEYFGREYNVQMAAVGGGLPYYLVIMEDLAFDEYRDINVYSFTVAMQAFLFILVTVQVVIMFLASAKRSAFKGQIFETDWIGPRKSSNWQYINSAGFNIALFLVLCIYPYETVVCRIFMLLVSVSCMPIFLNILFAYKYHGKKSPSKWYKIRAGAYGSAIPLIVSILAFASLRDSLVRFAIFHFICIPILIAFFFWTHWYFDPEKRKKNGLATKLKYNQTYTAVLVSWMLITTGLPVMIFFKASYNYDQHIIARYKQLEMLNAAVRSANLKKGGNSLTTAEKDKLCSTLYTDSYWINESGFTDRGADVAATDDEKTIDLINGLHIYESERLPAPLQLANKAAFDFSFYFNNLMQQIHAQDDKTITAIRTGPREYFWVSSSSLNSKLPSIFTRGGLTLWIIFASVLAAFFFVFYGLINKIFSIRIPDVNTPDDLKPADLTDKNQSAHLFLIGPAKIGVLDFIDDLPKNETLPGIKRYEIDLALIPDKDDAASMQKWNNRIAGSYENDADYDLIILNHFEYNYKNVRANFLKLALIEKLISKTKSGKILILSTIHPVTLLETLSATPLADLGNHSIERWHEILSKFRIALNRISEVQAFEALGITADAERNDSVIFRSFTASYHFYFSIWQSLSKEEKFFLYDLAEDGLVNSYDKNTLALLLDKGLILQRDGRLRFFTKGFRNFILNGLGPVEMGKLIEKINDNRNWNRIRLPLVMISLAILAFILSSQHESSTKLITSLGALAAVIPTIINFLGTLGGTSVAKKPGS